MIELYKLCNSLSDNPELIELPFMSESADKSKSQSGISASSVVLLEEDFLDELDFEEDLLELEDFLE